MNTTPANRRHGHVFLPALSFARLTMLVVLFHAAVLAGSPHPALAGAVPIPPSLAPKLSVARDAQAMAEAFLNIPYVDDATVDENGRFTLFEHPETILAAPGLNCSGFTLSLARFLLQRNVTLETAKADAGRDSGPDSPYGHDWDFGFDLIRNLSQGLPRRVMLPDGSTPDMASADGHSLRGFPIADTSAWRRVMAHFRPGHLYLASISKPVKTKGYTLLHYHVGLIVPGPDGAFSFYHATPKSGSHRISLAAPQGLTQLQAQFQDKSHNEKYILLVEVPLAVK